MRERNRSAVISYGNSNNTYKTYEDGVETIYEYKLDRDDCMILVKVYKRNLK